MMNFLRLRIFSADRFIRMAATRRLLSGNNLVRVNRTGRNSNIGLITLCDRKTFNAISSNMLEELNSALCSFECDDDISTIVLTGSTRAFSAGAYIKELSAFAFDEIFRSSFTENLAYLMNIKKPTIAAVNGVAFGAGFELALMCDIVYAGHNAKFCLPEIKLGILPGGGGTQNVTRIGGKSFAMEMCLTGDEMNAFEAYERRFVSKVFPSEKLLENTIKLAEEISERHSADVSVEKGIIKNFFKL